MKNVMASVGLVAIGAFTIPNAQAQMSTGADKPWSVSGTLRGFYDDNYTTAPSSSHRPSSFGFEARPSASVDLKLPQTDIKLAYVMSMKYYDDRVNNKADWSHDFEGFLNHSFSERYSLELSDSFVIAQEPDLIDPSNHSVTQRVNGNNVRNAAGINFHAKASEEISFTLGYANTLYNYDQNEGDVARDIAAGNAAPGTVSRSGQLDRMEQNVTLTTRWQFAPETAAILGYQFGDVGYTSNEKIGTLTPGGPAITSDVRNNRSHYIFTGADHNFSRDLSASIRVGAQITDYYNDPSQEKSISPYVDLSGTYVYAEGDSVLIGFTHRRSQTDLVGASQISVNNIHNLTLDQESSVFYASLTHKLTPKLKASLTGQYQISDFNNSGDPTVKNASDNFILVGVNLNYQFTRFLSGEAGYNYDNLTSGVPGRGYDRNRVYLGVTATY